MTRDRIISELKHFFDIRELVGSRVYAKHGKESWMFFDTDLLHCLLITRKGINKPFHVNNWHVSNSNQIVYDERGFRDNQQRLFKDKTLDGIMYLSGHVTGKAIDFKVDGMSSENVRRWIVANAKLYPCKLRLEHKMRGKIISWVHFDVYQIERHPKIYLFNV